MKQQARHYNLLLRYEVVIRYVALAILSTSTLLAILWLSGAKGTFAPWIVGMNTVAAFAQGVLALANRTRPKAVRDMSREEMMELVVASNPRCDWERVEYGDRSISLYRSDPQLRIENLHSDAGIENDTFEEPWANGFPNPHAISYRYNLFYGQSLLRRTLLVSVDGGRCLLPLPQSRTDLTVKPFDYRVAQIHEGQWSLDEYMGRANLRVANELWVN